MHIGVFDSGKGGAIVASHLQQTFPDLTFVVVDDHDHVPYGNRSLEQIISLTTQAIQPLLATCPIIIIACNTATAIAIEHLRQGYPSTQFIGFEPMLKTAASLAQHITVLATPATITSKRYQLLKQTHCQDVQVDEPDVSSWASLIELGQADRLSYDSLQKSVETGSQVIILACTHYLAVEQKLAATFPSTTVLQPVPAIAARLRALIS